MKILNQVLENVGIKVVSDFAFSQCLSAKSENNMTHPKDGIGYLIVQNVAKPKGIYNNICKDKISDWPAIRHSLCHIIAMGKTSELSNRIQVKMFGMRSFENIARIH